MKTTSSVTGFILHPDGTLDEVSIIQFLEWLGSEEYAKVQRLGMVTIEGKGAVSTVYMPQIMTRRLRALGGLAFMRPFETVIFWAGKPLSEGTETYGRWATYDEAKAGHDAAVKHVKEGEFTFRIGKLSDP